jgi:fatty-acyl-CoA synthase
MPRDPSRDTDPMDDVVRLFAGSPATFRFDDGTALDGPTLVSQGRRLATALTHHGVRPGDRLALRLPNGVDYVRALLACAAGGFVAVSVNTRYSRREIDGLVSRSGARPPDFTAVLTADIAAWSRLEPAPSQELRDEAFVVFTTSGTTAAPKMVLHRQHSIADHARDAAIAFGYGPRDAVLVVMPLGGTFGLTSLTAAAAGAADVHVSNFDAVHTARLIAEHRITAVNGSDDMFHRLLERGADLSTIRLGGYARFNTSLDGIVERAAAAGATLTGLYGMSEVQALFSVRSPAGSAAERSRAGGTLVSPRAAYRVVDDELHLKGPSLFAGYLAEGGDRVDDDLTRRHVIDGWFHTGDLAAADGDRTFEYLARIGDALRIGGFLVGPAEIEQVLMEFPGIAEAQVVAVDRPGGARPVAFVIAPRGIDEHAVIEHCRARLARFKVPVRVLTLDEFPTTASANGTKIQKVRLRELAAVALDEQPN